MINVNRAIIAICFLAVLVSAYFFIDKSRTADSTGKPEKTLLNKEIQPFLRILKGEPFHYFDRIVISGLESREMTVKLNNFPGVIDQVAKNAGWSFHSSHVGPYSRSYRYCKGRLSFNVEIVSDANDYWQYGIYWESDPEGNSYCRKTQ